MARESREERLAKKRAYNAKHAEEKRVYDAIYYQENIEECRVYDREYNEAHREERRCAAIVYRIENKEKIAIARALKYQKDKEKVTEKLAIYRALHKDSRREYDAERYAANIVEERARKKSYRLANPEKMQELGSRKRARKANAPINDLMTDQFLEICQVFNFRCAYCPPTCKACKNKTHKLTQDHIQALSRDGSHTVQNVVPCCQSCNSKKGTGPPLVPVQPLLLTIAPSKKKKAA